MNAIRNFLTRLARGTKAALGRIADAARRSAGKPKPEAQQIIVIDPEQGGADPRVESRPQ